ncbi:AAA+ superfamily ATPase [Candidatus Kinetoplastibacterium desouzaii TCC079E]|uniref:AAA+ superfamily ATPase n=1 Tax=Candidatus Kinetoplastidibacterium desouzai TCC079E TaxID=1208919 RepID=M1L1I1_9PROT|nr:ATP-binding protein [Candidatus Kinetoplastibacterium desouzaii]AGF46628.1 AAA+ superfamily ATPase [Candidatus Kinetoplastibacterium desouzaii TCC079E]
MESFDIIKLYSLTEKVLNQLSAWLPPVPIDNDWKAHAYKWRKQGTQGYLHPIYNISKIDINDLHNISRQKNIIDNNTFQFIKGKPANNVLMTGARGTGKSSLVKAMLDKYHSDGLRLIEIEKSDLNDLFSIVEIIADRPEKFIIFCDDLSFEEGESGYKELKSILDGSISSTGTNILIYATSNRRHLIPENFNDNLQKTIEENGDIHPGERVEEKISLSERFGIWISFYPFNQETYLSIVSFWINKIRGTNIDNRNEFRNEAIQWALERGSRSGRIAHQFARHWIAQHDR